MKKIRYWILPEGVYHILAALFSAFLRTVSLRMIEEKHVLLRNRKFKDLHKGKRCFILGCGPSIKKQNLKLLQGEICISVTSFFVHPDFTFIKPKYHCVSPLHPPFTEGDYIRLMKAMEPFMKETNLFLGIKQRRIIRQNNLFSGDMVYHLDFIDSYSRLFNKTLDLTRPLPLAMSISVIALMLAIYLGCNEVYLLGIEHVSFNLSGKFDYHHFYDDKDTRTIGESLEPEDLEIEFWSLEILWRQYKAIRSFAEKKGIRIFNAAEGGLLDLFPRVKYETLFK